MITFNIFEDSGGYYRWRVVGENGEIVATSEAYTLKQNAVASAKRVIIFSVSAEIYDMTPSFQYEKRVHTEI